MPPEPAGTGAPQLFLRSPPFDWVRADVAAVTGSARARATVAEAEAALDLLRAARVGGNFWEPAGPLGDCWAHVENIEAVQVDTPDSPLAYIAWLCGRSVRDGSGAEIAPTTIHDLLIATLAAPAYRNPFTGEPATIAQTIELLGDWRRTLDANRAFVATAGMAAWKRQAITHFLWDGRKSPPTMSDDEAVARARTAGGAVGYWPSRVAADFATRVTRAGALPVAVEDGFIRSEGLGADCRVPFSIAVDRGGAYYDPAMASDLEAILAGNDFAPELLARAAALRRRIRDARITKYGIDSGAPPSLPAGRRIVLAIGQVDDDLSVQLAGAGIPGNAAFLERVRAEEPEAYIIYRPHPDVVAGHRAGHVSAAAAARLVDEVRDRGSLLSLVEAVDAVHVLSSQTGFEALLREREVVVHGQPFYAGWGLTRDLAPALLRRGRQLSLDQLVAGALILYPRYLDPVTGLPCGPEVLIDRMVAGAAAANSLLTRARRAQGAMRRGATLLREALT